MIASRYHSVMRLVNESTFSSRSYPSTISTRWSSSITVADNLRHIMRGIPQPVALVVTRLPNGTLHGATISSFTSISLHPPLITFSLRTPSRLVDALDGFESDGGGGGYITVSLLSTRGKMLAEAFSQPGAEHERWFSRSELWKDITMNGDEEKTSKGRLGRLPIVSDNSSMGGMLCQIVKRISWVEESRRRLVLHHLEDGGEQADNGSTTFVAKVLSTEEVGERREQPLLYCNREYVGVGELLKGEVE